MRPVSTQLRHTQVPGAGLALQRTRIQACLASIPPPRETPPAITARSCSRFAVAMTEPRPQRPLLFTRRQWPCQQEARRCISRSSPQLGMPSTGPQPSVPPEPGTLLEDQARSSPPAHSTCCSLCPLAQTIPGLVAEPPSPPPSLPSYAFFPLFVGDSFLLDTLTQHPLTPDVFLVRVAWWAEHPGFPGEVGRRREGRSG